MLTDDQLAQYTDAGYIVIPGLLAPDETDAFRSTARDELTRAKDAGELMAKGDAAGKRTLLKLWNEAGDDLYGRVARDERLVGLARAVLDDELYVYSHKMTMKEPLQGGAWEWHQDFGYWYQNRCLAPEMLSIWIGLDPSSRENGCLQVLPGSHKLGRLDHSRNNDQTVVDEEYLAAALARFETTYVEMEAGDALVFHCNLLHRSDANTSDHPRWGYIVSYNTVGNQPFRDVRAYGHYHKLESLPAGSFRDRT